MLKGNFWHGRVKSFVLFCVIVKILLLFGCVQSVDRTGSGLITGLDPSSCSFVLSCYVCLVFLRLSSSFIVLSF